MKNLSMFIKRIKNFSQLKSQKKLLIIKAFILTAIFRFLILCIPFRIIKKHMGNMHEESSEVIESNKYEKAKEISWAIQKVARVTPWESKCLVQALSAQRLLYSNNIDSTLYLGVRKEKISQNKKMIAHSWIRCGKLYVTGGYDDNYAVVAKFMKRSKIR